MNPITRQEIFLAAASGEGNEIPEPITREEMYLKKIAENGGGGGTGGTTNYNALSNKPKINSVELSGNKSLADLGIPTKTSQLTNDDNVVKDASYVHTDNNYDATAKNIVDGVNAALSGKVDNSKLGAINGVAQLGEDGKLLSSQMPGSIDHIIEAYYNDNDGKFYEEATYETEITPQSSVIYVSLDTNKTYRWSGTQYVEISASLALGETAQTAYPGNKGKANADAIDGILDGTNIDSFGDVETALSGKINTTSRGAANGVAGLDANGKVPTTQLPDLLGLGETAQTAYAGDKGKQNADDITAIKDGTNIDSFADVETALGNKADKVSGATNNNFAALDASGNLKDSGKKASDFQTALTFDNAPTENSNNPVKSNGLYVANRNIYEAMSEMGAKNLFRVMNASQVINGIEWVVNDDGTITANGTATEESKFTAQSKSAATHYYDENMMKAIAGKTIRYSGCPSGGSSSTYLFRLYIANAGGSTDEYGEGAERAIVSDFLERNFSVECIIKSGQTVTNLTYKPMICLASDKDTTYQPYSKTNKQITDDTASAVANVPNGAINLAKPVSARTTTINDVEFVIDSEGKVTANGTASANIRFDMAEVTLKAGRTYQLYEPSSLQARRPLNPESCRCYARNKSSGVWVLQNNGWRDSYTPSSDVVVSVGIAMQSGNQVTDEVFAPMLVLDGTDVGDTFYPYAMTNRELTANAWIGKPRSAWLNLGNKTTLTITVPITPYGGSYMQGSIKLFGFNNSTLIDCSFAFTLSKDNDSVNSSKLTNYGDSAVTLGSISTDGTNVTITLNNLTTYVNLMLFYGTSMHNSYVSNINMPEWTFS